MNATVISYALYLALAIPLTVWVARTLHKNGEMLASPVLLPLAARACRLISENRLTLSRLAGLEGDAVLAQEIEDAARDTGARSGAICEVVRSRKEGRAP